MNPSKSNKVEPLVKYIAAGMSAFMCIYGGFIIANQHYFGSTNKYGGFVVTADGVQAIIMGISIILIGLTPMALWAKSAKAAGFWAGACMVFGVLLFLAPYYIK